jgi:hypothetical protein
MTGPFLPSRRGVLRLGFGALLSAAGCDWQDLLDEDEGQAEPAAEERPASAEELRARAIREGVEALTEEGCRHAGGDWAKWSADLEGFRAALRAKIAAAKPNNPNAEGYYEARCPVIEAAGDPPLFECQPDWYLKYLVEPAAVEAFRRALPVAVVSRWLRGQGIDLLFVPVPKMTEVYPHRVARTCPDDRIVAPHVRRLLLELLRHDVEVVDLLPAFLEAAGEGEAPLYLPDDPHWAPRAQEIAARIICERLKRYDFVRLALRLADEGNPLFTAAEVPWEGRGAAYLGLTADQQRRTERARPRSHRDVAPAPGGGGLVSEEAMVLAIGDSYNGGLWQLVVLGLNQPLALQCGGGYTTQAIKEAVRNPDILRGRKVVLWVVCNTSLATGQWDLPPGLAPAGENLS